MTGESVLRAVVLAGERRDAGAASIGVLTDVGGRACIEHVVAALRGSHAVRGGLIVGPSEATVANSDVMQAVLRDGDYAWLAPADGPSASALAGVQALGETPVLLTAGDHALLQPHVVDAFCTDALARDADFVVGLVPYETVRAAFPDSRRTVLRFSDGAWCGSNLFVVRTAAGGRALAFWQALEHERKHPWRLALRVGPVHVLRYLARRLSTGAAFAALSARAGCRVAWTPVSEARAAVDVDSAADRALAQRVLAGR